MNKYIKNNSEDVITYQGQNIAVDAYYLIPKAKEIIWSNDSDLISAIGSGVAIVAKDDTGTSDIVEVSDAINFLKNEIYEVDSEGRQTVRYAAAKRGWSYIAHPIELETARIGSLYSKRIDNSNRGDVTMKFYDINGAEVTSAQYEVNIVRTEVLFKPNYDYELIAGNIHQIARPPTDVRIWVAGGIIELGVRYVKEFLGGLNLRYIGEDESIRSDGRVSKYMAKDVVGIQYQANQIQVVIRHNAGMYHKIMLILEYYRL